jgi:hypothetical protein
MKDYWKAFLTDIESAKVNLRDNPHDPIWFRGHHHSSWHLIPSLFRNTKEDDRGPSGIESKLFSEFKRLSGGMLTGAIDDWDLLFTMRHHGAATRLLDWTDILAVAIYFAITNQKDNETNDSPCIWLLNPLRLNEKSAIIKDKQLVDPATLDPEKKGLHSLLFSSGTGRRGTIPFSNPVAINPRIASLRQKAQGGRFTMHGNSQGCLAVLANERKKCAEKVALNQKAVAGAKQFLEDAGFDEYRLFPDLDGLARTLHKKFKFDSIPNPTTRI